MTGADRNSEMDFEATATRRTVTRGGCSYQVWDEYPHAKDWDFWTVFETSAWEPDLEEILDAHLTPSGTFVDVGAWIGPITLMGAARCSRVHAIEPDPVARRRLEANIGLEPRRNVTVWPVALCPSSGPVSLGHTPNGWFGDSMSSMIFTDEAIEVTGMTLDDLAAEAGITTIDLIKMDIEGGEETTLPACAPTIRRLGSPLLLSLHTAIVDDPDRYLTAVRAALDGFDLTMTSGDWGGLGTVLAVPR